MDRKRYRSSRHGVLGGHYNDLSLYDMQSLEESIWNYMFDESHLNARFILAFPRAQSFFFGKILILGFKRRIVGKQVL